MNAAGVPPPALDLTREQAWPADYASDPLWVRASTGDDIDQARLGQRESALTLLVALGHGGRLGLTALRSLAYTNERRDVLGELCTFAIGADPATRHLLLESIYDTSVNGAWTEESLGPHADPRCTQSLSALSRDATSPIDRDLAAGALAALHSP